MKTVRLYRAALRAYPPAYRKSRGPELLATLADGDDDRGHASAREAAALAYRGLAMRARLVLSPAGLLIASAAALLLAVMGSFTWAQHVFLFRGGEAAVYGTDGPEWWLVLGLALVAFLVLAAGPFRAADDPRRRRVAVLLSLPFALAIFTPPGALFHGGLPDWAIVAEFLKWSPGAIAGNWHMTLPGTLGAVLGTSVALRALGRMAPHARPRALAGALLVLGAFSIGQAWHRPDLPAEYAQSAFADLGTATFITVAGVALALAAALASSSSRSEPRRHSGSGWAARLPSNWLC